MESLFGKKKNRPRQSSVSVNQELNERSVPYHKLGPPQRSPVPVSSASQGIRGNSTAMISAPMTNPTLTANGTELNKYAMARTRADRERAYRDGSPIGRPGSPAASVSTNDSSTLYNDPDSPARTNGRRYRQSESSSSVDLAASSPASPNNKSRSFLGDSSTPSSRPTSAAPTIATSRTDDKRSSRYAASLSSFDSHGHLSSLSSHLHRHGAGEFSFPRPENDEEIEALFENIRRTRGLGELPNLSIDQKWHMVYSDEQLKWKEEKQREEQARRQAESGGAAFLVEGTPEWYIKKFMDKTITAKMAGSLQVLLRGTEIRYVACSG
jgi:cytokinesis protein